MSSNKNIVLITGANGGIGFELAAQLLADPSQHVLLGSRSAEKGNAAVKELQSRNQPGTVELLQVDVDSEESIKAAAKEVESKHGRIDALVNNAAVASGGDGPLAERMAQCFKTNVTGVLLMINNFRPLLQKSTKTARIINVSSGAGSIARRFDSESPMYRAYGYEPYFSSKSALNMVTACQSVELGELGMKVFSYCPGYRVSNLSAMNTSDRGAKPTSGGATPMIAILKGEKDGEHGGFLRDIGGQYPW